MTRNKLRRLTPKSVAAGVAGNVIMMVYTLSCIFPIIWLIYSSFKTMVEFDYNVVALPEHWTLENYKYVLTSSDMPTYITNSLRNSVIAVVFILLFAFINGYFIARFRFRGRKLMYNYYLLGMLIPVHALLVPIYIVMNRVNLTNQWYTVVFPLICFNLPTSLFLCESYIGNIPREIDEAAAIDGAGFTRTLFTIILPMTTPILVTSGILAFFNCWNEFIFSLVLLKDQALYTIPLGLTLLQGTYRTSYPAMMAAMIIAMLPAMILYFIFNKQIINGMMSGAVKG